MEIQVRALPDVRHVNALHAEVVEAIRRAGPRAVICADHRLVPPLSPDVADAWARAMRRNNGDVALAGLLIDPANAMYNLQLERVVRCAGSSTRRVFVDLEALRDWVGPALTGAERDALSRLFSRASAD